MSSPERRESRPQDARPTEAAQPVDDRFPSAAEGDVPPPASPVVPEMPVLPATPVMPTTGDSSAQDASSVSASTPADSTPPALDDEEMELLSAVDEALAAAAEVEDDDQEDATRWDANDPRRKKDCFAPPTEPCQCHCLHCGREFSSDGIWFQRVLNDPQGFEGFWMCPTPNCSGAGFTFDIFPIDPNHPANEGWHYDDEDDDDFVPDDEDDNEIDNEIDSEQAVAEWTEAIAEDAEAEYDPSESKYKDMDEFLGNDDDDLEGEEWKFGLQPGERPVNAMQEEADREWQREQEMFDEPDQRPRVLDWSDREDRKFGPGVPFESGDGTFSDDDIPF